MLKCLTVQKKQIVNTILRKETCNMSIKCISVWDAVMKLTAVGKFHFSSDIRKFKNIKLLPPPFLYRIQFLRTSACVCKTSENCKSLVLQGKCNVEIFLSPAGKICIGVTERGSLKKYLEEVHIPFFKGCA